nr:hypothetical protein [Alkalibacterium thalassium]
MSRHRSDFLKTDSGHRYYSHIDGIHQTDIQKKPVADRSNDNNSYQKIKYKKYLFALL